MPGGRPRKPTKLKILEGNKGKRRIQPEPEPALGAPEPPDGMSEDAQGIWRAVAPELDRLGLLARIDGTSLEAACRGAAEGRWADRQKAQIQTFLETGGLIDSATAYQLSILTSMSKKGWMQWKSFATEFGLTAASRGKLSVSERQAIDPVDEAMFA